MIWDDEVDVVCCGSGFGGLATAIAAVDADQEVFIARSATEPVPGMAAAWLGAAVADQETLDYFEALSGDLGPLVPGPRDSDIATRVAIDLAPAVPAARIEPFFGARLRDWAAQCLVSPYGVLYTRVSSRGADLMKTRSGEEFQAKIIGTVEPDGGLSAASAVNEWLLAQARDRGIQISADSTLQRIVFEDGQVLGAVMLTPDGPFAVRARHGVAVAPGGRPTGAQAAPTPFADPAQPLQVCLVGHSASRFERIELLSSEAATDQARSAYCRSNRVHDGLRDAGRSHARRCREMHRYPPLG